MAVKSTTYRNNGPEYRRPNGEVVARGREFTPFVDEEAAMMRRYQVGIRFVPVHEQLAVEEKAQQSDADFAANYPPSTDQTGTVGTVVVAEGEFTTQQPALSEDKQEEAEVILPPQVEPEVTQEVAGTPAMEKVVVATPLVQNRHQRRQGGRR